MSGAGPTAVVTDSTADLPAHTAEERRILVVPALLVIDGVSYEDGRGLTRTEFYRRMPTMSAPPTTASPSVEAYRNAYRAAFDRGAGSVVSIHVAGRLSGIFEIARQAARSFSGRIDVIDSGQVSLGTGFQVLEAARASADGLAPEAVISAAGAIRDRIRTLAMIDDLVYLRRSGRVDWLRSTLGSVLHLRLIVELSEGVVRRLAQVRTRRRAVEDLIQRATAWGPLQRLGVLHSGVEAEAMDLASRMASQVRQEPPMVVEVTTVIGAHVGPRSLGLVGVLSPSRADGTA